MTQKAGPPAPEGTSQDSAPKPSADTPAPRITPALWMPAAPTLAWLAFGSAETDWDRAFYFGASIWYVAEPARVLDWLNEVAERGDLVPEFEPRDVSALHRHIESAAYTLGKGKQRGPSEDNIRQAARDFHATLASRMANVTAQRAAIWEASEKLRRALARGCLTACGWPGCGPTVDEDTRALPLREPIPRDIFARPVTITQSGVLGFARGDESLGDDFETLWSGLIFDSADLLALQEAPKDARRSQPYTEPAKHSRGGVGGRREDFDWPLFYQEIVRHLVLDDVPPKPDTLKKHMENWANEQWGDDGPSDSRIAAHIKRIVPRSVYI
jgi:hypothetical protein